MPILKGLTAALAWLGRQGTRALAASVFLGLALPPLAAVFKPWLGATVFAMLVFSYLRTDPRAFRDYVKRPAMPIVASLWVMIGMPLLFGAIYVLLGVPNLDPALYQVMVLHLVAAPITSSAAFAALLGLDVAFTLVTLIVSAALSPIFTVLFSYLFLGSSMFSPIDLGIKLFLFFGSTGATAAIIRRVAGQPAIERHKDILDGLNVIAIFIFAIVAMESVPRNVIASPLFALGVFALVVVLAVVMMASSALLFWRTGRDRALAIGMLTAFRNLGVIMAAIGASLPDTAWFYFALAQFPIYLMPALLKPLARHFTANR